MTCAGPRILGTTSPQINGANYRLRITGVYRVSTLIEDERRRLGGSIASRNEIPT